MTSTTIEKTITELCKLFASFGLPEQAVADNGPQFTSSQFDAFIVQQYQPCSATNAAIYIRHRQ